MAEGHASGGTRGLAPLPPDATMPTFAAPASPAMMLLIRRGGDCPPCLSTSSPTNTSQALQPHCALQARGVSGGLPPDRLSVYRAECACAGLALHPLGFESGDSLRIVAHRIELAA